MKTLMFILLIFVIVSMTSSCKTEQTVLFIGEKMEYGRSTGADVCADRITKKMPDMQLNLIDCDTSKGLPCFISSTTMGTLMAEGWRVISSTPKQIVLSTLDLNRMDGYSFGCVCYGTEYVIEKTSN